MQRFLAKGSNLIKSTSASRQMLSLQNNCSIYNSRKVSAIGSACNSLKTWLMTTYSWLGASQHNFSTKSYLTIFRYVRLLEQHVSSTFEKGHVKITNEC